jgi:hypothetical protein
LWTPLAVSRVVSRVAFRSSAGSGVSREGLFSREQTEGATRAFDRSVGSIGRSRRRETGAAKRSARITRVERSVASAGNRRWFGLLPAVGADVDAVEDERRRAASNDGRVERVGVVARGGVRRRRGVGVER